MASQGPALLLILLIKPSVENWANENENCGRKECEPDNQPHHDLQRE